MSKKHAGGQFGVPEVEVPIWETWPEPPDGLLHAHGVAASRFWHVASNDEHGRCLFKTCTISKAGSASLGECDAMISSPRMLQKGKSCLFNLPKFAERLKMHRTRAEFARTLMSI